MQNILWLFTDLSEEPKGVVFPWSLAGRPLLGFVDGIKTEHGRVLWKGTWGEKLNAEGAEKSGETRRGLVRQGVLFQTCLALWVHQGTHRGRSGGGGSQDRKRFLTAHLSNRIASCRPQGWTAASSLTAASAWNQVGRQPRNKALRDPLLFSAPSALRFSLPYPHRLARPVGEALTVPMD
jgi:hypothetical protein